MPDRESEGFLIRSRVRLVEYHSHSVVAVRLDDDAPVHDAHCSGVECFGSYEGFDGHAVSFICRLR